jgi:hypothetical protein
MKTHVFVRTTLGGRALSALLIAFPLITVPSYGQTVTPMVEHASICKAAGSDPATNQLRSYHGVFNPNKWDVDVVCPIVRGAYDGVGGMGVTVTGRAGSIGVMTCTLMSHAFDGSMIIGDARPIGSGDFSQTLMLSAGVVSSTTTQYVLCNLTPGSTLFSVQVFVP